MNQFNQNILVAFWQSTTIVNKLFIIIATVFWFIELFIGDQLKFQPASLQTVWIWQLITSGFVQGSILSLLFNLICLPDLNNAERRLGSILYMFEFAIKNTLGMALVYASAKLICLIDYRESIMLSNHYGFWNIAVYFITSKTLKQPNEETQVLFFPVVLKARYYLLGLLFVLQFSSTSRYTVLLFAQIAIFEHILNKGPLLRLPKKIIESIEKKSFLQKYVSRQDFIPIDQAYDLVFSGTQRIEFQVENFHKDMELSPPRGMNNSSDKVPTDDDSMQIKQ